MCKIHVNGIRLVFHFIILQMYMYMSVYKAAVQLELQIIHDQFMTMRDNALVESYLKCVLVRWVCPQCHESYVVGQCTIPMCFVACSLICT